MDTDIEIKILRNQYGSLNNLPIDVYWSSNGLDSLLFVNCGDVLFTKSILDFWSYNFLLNAPA